MSTCKLLAQEIFNRNRFTNLWVSSNSTSFQTRDMARIFCLLFFARSEETKRGRSSVHNQVPFLFHLLSCGPTAIRLVFAVRPAVQPMMAPEMMIAGFFINGKNVVRGSSLHSRFLRFLAFGHFVVYSIHHRDIPRFSTKTDSISYLEIMSNEIVILLSRFLNNPYL